VAFKALVTDQALYYIQQHFHY